MKNDINSKGIATLPFKERIEDEDIDISFLEKLPLAFIKKNLVLPLKKDEERLMVALASPEALFALDDIGNFFSTRVSPVIVPGHKILEAINRFYERFSGSAQEVIDDLGSESLESIAHRWDEPKDLLDLTDEAPIIKLLNSLLFQAVKEMASDIHIEPFEREVDVRLRRDGVLRTILSPPKLIQEAMVSRVKIMAGLDIAEKRLPQDGRISLLVAGKDVDVRVSIVPTTFGERVVLRLLNRKGGNVGLSQIGLSPDKVEDMESLLLRTSGIILATGPTGSGKTTTLYACLNRINRGERNIITIEDPVEYQLKGAGQIPVNTKIGLTFANGLRSILRQDPDIIMVGEIRDTETAEMAIQASLTGHLVLSTLHTNDAPSTITRLVDMGIQPFLLSSSLSAVIAQRLVRVLCENCKEEYTPTDEELPILGSNPTARLWRPNGCDRCFKTGYSGQTGIFEFMRIDNGMRSTMLKNSDSTTITGYALSKGMMTLKDDGLIKVKSGITSLEEVLRVTHSD